MATTLKSYQGQIASIRQPEFSFPEGNLFDLIKQTTKVFFDQFIFENSISSDGLEISIFDHLIEEWENFKDYISGKKSSTDFEKLYYLQNTIIDNYHSFIYTLKI